MRRQAIMAVTLAALVPWTIALAEKEVELELEEHSIVHFDSSGERHIFTIDASGLNEMIEEVMEVVEQAIEGSQRALNSALRSSTDAMRFQRLAKAESGDYRTVDETKSTGDRPKIKIRNLAGSVRVVGSDKNEVRVEGTIGENVEELVFDASRSSVKIRVKIPSGRNRKVKSDLTIYVPKGSSVAVATTSAKIEIEGIEGESIDLESVSGSISVNNCSGELKAQSTSGRLTVAGNFVETDLETVNGSIRASGKLGHVEASSISGAITINAGTLDELEVETLSGSIRFDGMAGDDADFEISSFSGSVRLTFDQEVSGEFDLRSFSGGINCDFGPAPKRSGRFGPAKKLQFTHGDGDADIAVETFSGSISIRVR